MTVAVACTLPSVGVDVLPIFNISGDHSWAVDATTCPAPDHTLPQAEGYCCGPSSPKPFRVLVCAVPTLNATGQSRVTPPLR